MEGRAVGFGLALLMFFLYMGRNLIWRVLWRTASMGWLPVVAVYIFTLAIWLAITLGVFENITPYLGVTALVAIARNTIVAVFLAVPTTLLVGYLLGEENG